jgi:hypothetical protein
VEDPLTDHGVSRNPSQRKFFVGLRGRRLDCN